MGVSCKYCIPPPTLPKPGEVINILVLNVDYLHKVKLMKMLWYSDQLCYKRYGRSITGMAYKVLPIADSLTHKTICHLYMIWVHITWIKILKNMKQKLLILLMSGKLPVDWK
ncbi:MAG: type II toxin-antitoxin system antitoxin SocA domain-containing protein [Anaerocolumna sp.]